MNGDRPRGAPEGFRLPRAARIRGTNEIRELFRRGKRRRTGHLDVFFAASPVARPRWGMVVPKHRREIVERNRLRRRLRHIGRSQVLPRLWEAGRSLDVLVRARREAYDAPYGVLEDELVGVTEELCSGPRSSC
ncbi:MAG: ribonuclease P protein component [Gemmatimonadota bacterium]